MKNIIRLTFLALGLFFFLKTSSAQLVIYDNYSNANLWTEIDPANSSTNDVKVNGPNHLNVCYYQKMEGQTNSDTRVYRSLNTILNNQWTTEIDFILEINTVTNNGGFYPIVLTAGNLAPERDNSFSAGNPAITNQDGIGVVCYNNSNNETKLAPWLKDGTSMTLGNCDVTIQVGTKYKIRLERLDIDKGRFTVFAYDSKGNLINNPIEESCCITIPRDITGLTHVQTANSIGYNTNVNMNGYVDNLFISQNITPCCPFDGITGNTSICSQNTQSQYCVYGNILPGTTLNWIVPACVGSWTGNGTTCINILNWGSCTGLQYIKLVYECNCEKDTITLPVYINPDSSFYNFSVSTSTSSGSSVFSATGTALNTIPSSLNVTDVWTLYLASNYIPGDYTVTGNAISTSTSSPFTVSNLSKTQYYIMRRTITFINSECPPIVINQKISMSKSAIRAISANNSSEYSESGTNPKIYPNPTSDLLNIEIPDNTNKIVKIIIIDNQGHEVITKDLNNMSKIQVSTKNLQKGVYLIKFIGDENIEAIKFTKN